jgi:TPR repeat protein
MPGRLSLRIGIAVFALLMAASLPVRADYRSAVSAYENGAYEAALGEFRTLAQSGDPAAQYHLALMFKDGRGVRRDPVTALGWFLCAAGSDGQVGTGAARSAEQLSSALDRASVSTAQERARNCRATAEKHAPQRTGEESERPGIAKPLDWETFKAKLSRFFQRLSLEIGRAHV